MGKVYALKYVPHKYQDIYVNISHVLQLNTQISQIYPSPHQPKTTPSILRVPDDVHAGLCNYTFSLLLCTHFATHKKKKKKNMDKSLLCSPTPTIASPEPLASSSLSPHTYVHYIILVLRADDVTYARISAVRAERRKVYESSRLRVETLTPPLF